MYLSRKLNSPHALLWSIYAGTGVTQTTQFMVMPFMALYMSSETGASPGLVGLAVGMMPLTTTVFSFIGGTLADRYGRKRLMSVAMLMNAMAMVGFAEAHHSVLLFFIVSSLTGLSRALFGPASQAMMTDITEPSRRARAFGINYWMNNIGASLGPVLGGYFGTVQGGKTFYVAAVVSLIYAVVIILIFPESKQPIVGDTRASTFIQSVRIVRSDKALLIFIIAGVLTSLGYSQFDTTLPQIMKSLFGATIASHEYSYLFAATGIEVVLLQFVVNRFADRLGKAYPLVVSQFIYALSFIGFGLSHSFWGFLLWGIVLTIGEMIAAPRTAQYISLIADDRNVGTYFGAYSLTNLGYFIGPTLGGIVLHGVGGMAVFVIVGILAVIAGPMYAWSYSVNARKKQALENVHSAI